MFHVIVCGFNCNDTIDRCLASIEMQTFKDYKVHVSKDGTRERRKYLLKNTVDTIILSGARPDDVLVFVDADDFLCDDDAFAIVDYTYGAGNRPFLTYGSYCNLSTNERGKFCGPYKEGESFACSQWRGSHLKTMKRKLFDAIPENRFFDSSGNWFKCCADRAIMTPAMELAGLSKINFIETVLYCYDDTNPLSCWRTNKRLSIETRDYISSRKPLQRIT